jgi:hypothetical protein
VTVLLAINAGQRGNDVACRMRDEWRMVVRQKHTVTLKEIEQIRHLFEIGGNVGVVSTEMAIVELDRATGLPTY